MLNANLNNDLGLMQSETTLQNSDITIYQGMLFFKNKDVYKNAVKNVYNNVPVSLPYGFINLEKLYNEFYSIEITDDNISKRLDKYSFLFNKNIADDGQPIFEDKIDISYDLKFLNKDFKMRIQDSIYFYDQDYIYSSSLDYYNKTNGRDYENKVKYKNIYLNNKFYRMDYEESKSYCNRKYKVVGRDYDAYSSGHVYYAVVGRTTHFRHYWVGWLKSKADEIKINGSYDLFLYKCNGGTETWPKFLSGTNYNSSRVQDYDLYSTEYLRNLGFCNWYPRNVHTYHYSRKGECSGSVNIDH